MAAQLLPLDEVLQQEYLLIAQKDDHSLTGTELTLERALATARTLASTGWRVVVESCDPFLIDGVRYTMEPRP